MSEKLKNLEKKGLKVEQTTVKKKRKLSGVPGSVKESVCNRLGDYLKVINFLGDDYMSQRQFIQFCYELDMVEKDDRDTKITAIINDLVKADLVKKTRIGVTNAKMLLLTKYAKRWLIGAVTSQEVSATKAYKSDKPYLKSIMRMDYFLKEILPVFLKTGTTELEAMRERLKINKNTLLLKRKEAGAYYVDINRDQTFKADLDVNRAVEICRWCYYRLAVDKQRLNHPLNELEIKALKYDEDFQKGAYVGVWEQLKFNLKDDVASTKLEIIRREDIYLRTMYELINRDVVVHNVLKRDGFYVVNFRVFDAYNNADSHKIERSILATINMFKAVFKDHTNIKFYCTIYAFNEDMRGRIERAISQRLAKEADDPKKAILYRYGTDVAISYYSMDLHSRYLVSEE